MNINKTGKFLGAPGGADAFDDHVDPTITVSDRIGMTDSKRGMAQLESLKRDASDAGTMAGEGKRLNSGVGGPTELARTISVDDDDATPTPTPRTRASLDVAFTADDVDGEEVRVAVEKPEASTRDPTRPGGDAFAPPTEKAKGAGGTFIAGAFRIGADVHYVEKKSDAPFAPGDLRENDEDASDRGTKTTKSTRFEDPADMLRARTRESNPTEAAHGVEIRRGGLELVGGRRRRRRRRGRKKIAELEQFRHALAGERRERRRARPRQLQHPSVRRSLPHRPERAVHGLVGRPHLHRPGVHGELDAVRSRVRGAF